VTQKITPEQNLLMLGQLVRLTMAFIARWSVACEAGKDVYNEKPIANSNVT